MCAGWWWCFSARKNKNKQKTKISFIEPSQNWILCLHVCSHQKFLHIGICIKFKLWFTCTYRHCIAFRQHTCNKQTESTNFSLPPFIVSLYPILVQPSFQQHQRNTILHWQHSCLRLRSITHIKLVRNVPGIHTHNKHLSLQPSHAHDNSTDHHYPYIAATMPTAGARQYTQTHTRTYIQDAPMYAQHNKCIVCAEGSASACFLRRPICLSWHYSFAIRRNRISRYFSFSGVTYFFYGRNARASISLRFSVFRVTYIRAYYNSISFGPANDSTKHKFVQIFYFYFVC